MLVRPAVLDDAERIAEVNVLSWQVGYRGLLPQPLLDGLHLAQGVPRWRAAIERTAWPGRGTLVADDVGDVLGFADLCPTRDDDQDAAEVGEIAAFYVLPTAWGQGVGRRLMAAAVHMSGVAGFGSATLWVLEANARARRFYTRRGWEPDGAVRDGVLGGTATHEVRYRRELKQ